MDMYEGNLTNTLDEVTAIACRCLESQEVVQSDAVRESLSGVSFDNSFQFLNAKDLALNLEKEIHRRCPEHGIHRGAEIRIIAEEVVRMLEEARNPGGVNEST